MTKPVGSSQENVGGDAVLKATGKGREEWFALLDAAGAAQWTHKVIATWLATEQGVDSWWSQGVTVAYEQARGIRQPGQRRDGTFEASVTRTISLEKEAGLRALAQVVTGALEVEPLALNLEAKHQTARFPLDGGEFVLASASDRDGGRSSLGLTWGRMPDDSRLAEVKSRMREWLRAVG